MATLIGRYWPFVAVCAAAALLVLRLILREHLTLQRSLSYLGLLAALGALALFPRADDWLAVHMGFTLTSNWFFALSIAGLTLLHLSTLVSLSRAELRTIALTQHVGMLEERVERFEQLSSPAPQPPNRSRSA